MASDPSKRNLPSFDSLPSIGGEIYHCSECRRSFSSYQRRLGEVCRVQNCSGTLKRGRGNTEMLIVLTCKVCHIKNTVPERFPGDVCDFNGCTGEME